MRGLGRNFIWNQTYNVWNAEIEFLFSKDKSVNSPANTALLVKSQSHRRPFERSPVSQRVHGAEQDILHRLLFLHSWPESSIIIRGHVIDRHLLEPKQSVQA